MALSCHRNRVKINEDELASEILLREKAEENKLVGEKQYSDSLERFTKGLHFREDRSVDLKNPPVTIDIAGSLNNIKEIKLSDVASTISYTRMEPVPDSTIPRDLKFKYYMMDNYIVVLNLYGIHLYSKEGKYIRSVVKNEFTGVIAEPDRILFWNDYTMKGGGMSVQVNGNSLFYNYNNNITGQKYIMEYDCSSIPMKPDYKFDPENPDQVSGLGSVAIDLNHGKTESPKPRTHQGMFGGPPEAFFYDESVTMLNPDSYALPIHGEKMMVILNNQGDTLSAFTRLEKLVNYTKTMMRGTDDGTQYAPNGVLYSRPAFNDTVFRVSFPNRLTPVYVLKLGEYKVTKQQGVDPGFSLTGKIIPEEWAETRNFIFLTFTKDDYDCPNTRKNKTVKIYHALYSKQDKLLSVIKGDPFNYIPEILENDIDGGVPVWPRFYMISKDGDIMIPLKGTDLINRIKSNEFKLSKAPADKKKELEGLAGSLSDAPVLLFLSF